MTDPRVVRIAGFGLAGGPPGLDGGIDADDWPNLLSACRGGRVIGVLAAAAMQGAVSLTDSQALDLAVEHERLMTSALQLEAALIDVGGRLSGAGIDWRVVKGPASAHLVYDDPAQRTFVDLDLLVPSAQIAAAVSLIEDLGAKRALPALAPDYDSRFAKSVTLRLPTAEIDLHRTVAPGPFGLVVDEADLFGDPVVFTLAGIELATVSGPVALVHACYHAVLGGIEPPMSTLRDIALMVADPDLDADAVVDLAERWRGAAVAAAGLTMAHELVPDARWPLLDWADELSVGRLDRFLLRSYARRSGRFGRQAAASLLVLPTWRERSALVRSVVWPTREHLAARDLGRRSHLRSMARRR